jgi:hypothetical protein
VYIYCCRSGQKITGQKLNVAGHAGQFRILLDVAGWFRTLQDGVWDSIRNCSMEQDSARRFGILQDGAGQCRKELDSKGRFQFIILQDLVGQYRTV